MVSTSTDKDTFVLNLRQHEGTLVRRELATRVCNYIHGATLLSLMIADWFSRMYIFSLIEKKKGPHSILVGKLGKFNQIRKVYLED